MPVTFVRHTTPDIDLGLCYGRTDLDVKSTFENECRITIQKLSSVDRVISSPLRRCLMLAERISNEFNAPLSTDPRIAEFDFGRWEGVAWNAIPRHELDEWAADVMHARPHGGENVAALKKRVTSALAEYQSLSGHTILVTHSGVIRVALSSGDTIDDFSTNVDFGGVLRYSPTGEPDLE